MLHNGEKKPGAKHDRNTDCALTSGVEPHSIQAELSSHIHQQSQIKQVMNQVREPFKGPVRNSRWEGQRQVFLQHNSGKD